MSYFLKHFDTTHLNNFSLSKAIQFQTIGNQIQMHVSD